MAIHPETFLRAAKMAKGNWYSLIVPHLALMYKLLGEFCVIHEEVKTTYEWPWSIVIRYLGMYFPQMQGKFMLMACFLSSFNA